MERYEVIARRFGKNVKYCRERIDISAQELAGRIGLKSRQHIYNIESGKTTSLKTMVELSRAFNLSLSNLLDRELYK